MNADERLKLEQYLKDNYKQEGGLGDQLLDFFKKNNLKTFFSDTGASLIAPSLGMAGIFSKNRGSSDKEKDESEKEKLTLWMNRQMSENESFQRKLLSFMKKRGYEEQPSKFYNKISLDRRVYSRISSEAYKQQPDKKTVFKLIIGLELELSDANELLKSAGFSFNCHKKFDMIIKYCVENGVYGVDTVDEYLVDFEEKPLFSLE